VVRHPERAADVHVDRLEVASWLEAASAMVVPFDHELGVTAQSEGFTRYRPWDFDATRDEEYPLLLNYPYYLLYSSQVIKQADLVMALYLCGDRFEPEQKARDFEYYEAITVRDSTLSAAIQAIVAAEVGHLDLAYGYFRETAFVDLRDLAGNTSDGLHLASMAGAWLVAVAGFGGMRDYGETLAFAPRLPETLTGLSFRMMYRDRRIHVDVNSDHARYELLAGEPLDLLHHGQPITIAPDAPQTCSYPPLPARPPIAPPPGREACRHGVGANGHDSAQAVRHSY
jgi:alpha,alpha-trehalose phosphorylase